MNWNLAKSFTLRVNSGLQQALARALPTLATVIALLVCVLLNNLIELPLPPLAFYALIGYITGSYWLLGAWKQVSQPKINTVNSTDSEPALSDKRHTFLKIAHSFSDVFLSTAVVLVWQRLYGSIETGWMTTLLRFFNFLPVLVTMAWAQVALTKPNNELMNPWLVGLGALACLSVLALCCLAGLYFDWLDPRWNGLIKYLAPLLLWQGCASFAAAFSHIPFKTQSASRYSWACMSIVFFQTLALLTPVAIELNITPNMHMMIFGFTSFAGLLLLTLWMNNLRKEN
jgi:hypothetical protein